MTTLLLAEHDNKSLKDSTNKALTAAKALGGDVHILVAGKDAKAVADAAAKLDGVKKVLLADGALYEHALAEPLAALIVSLAGPYDAIVAPATSNGKNVIATCPRFDEKAFAAFRDQFRGKGPERFPVGNLTPGT